MKVRELPPPIPYSILRGHRDAVNSIDFLRENHGLLSGDVIGKVMYWNVKTLQVLKEWRAHDASVLTVQSLTPTSLVTSGRDGLIKLWDITNISNRDEQQQSIQTILSRCRHFCNISSSEKDGLIASADESAKTLLWDIRTPNQPVGRIEPKHVNNDSPGMLMSVLLATEEQESGNLKCVIGGYEDGSIAVSDIRTMSTLQLIPRQHTQPVFALASTSSNLQYILSGGGDQKLIRLSLESISTDQSQWSEVNAISLPQNGTNVLSCNDHNRLLTPLITGTSCIHLRSDERIIASSHWDGTVRLFDRKKLKCLGIFRQHKESVFGVKFGKKNTEEAAIFASCSKDGQIALWNLFADTYI